MLTHTGGRAGCGVAEVILILLWTNMFHVRLRRWAISFGMGPWMSWVGAAMPMRARTRTRTSKRTYVCNNENENRVLVNSTQFQEFLLFAHI